MRTLLVLLFGFFLLALESPLLYQLQLIYYAPDFALIVVIYLALTRPLLHGALAAFLLGFLKDGFAVGPMGMYMQILTGVYYLVKYVSSRVSLRGPWQVMLVTFCGSAISSLMFWLLSAVFDQSFSNTALVFKMLIPHALVTTPFAPIVFYVLGKFDKEPRTSASAVGGRISFD